MTNPFQPNLRKPWLLLCLTTVVTYAIVPVRHDSLFDLNAFSFWLEAVMFLLAFPLGDLFGLLFYGGEGSIGERFVSWTLALAIGYVQWFHILPALLKRKKARLNTLNLATGGNVAFDPAPDDHTDPARPEAPRIAEREGPPVPQFNHQGMTPLERVLRDGDERE